VAVPARLDTPDVPSPSLVVDRDVLERNIAAMAAHAASSGIVLRPHAKTHKCPAVGRRQIEAGAVGLTVATVGEAEVFADHGVDDLFVAYPLWAAGDVGRRLSALADRVRLSVGVDSVAGIHELRRAVRRPDALCVVVEVDSGLHRTGVAPEGAAAIAAAALDAGFLLGGVFTFPGHSYAPGMAAPARDDEARALFDAGASLAAAGIACPARSGGSTPTAAATPAGVVTELRPGVYVFNDAQQVALGTCAADDVALGALATVVSTPAQGRVVLDAGAKVLGPDRPAWAPGFGMLPDHPEATVTGLWEHHAVVDVSATPAAARPAVGERVAIVPNHVCSAVNLAKELWVVSEGKLVDRWEVAAAGANR
jgi:D-serine deaminase-like pyridoxal phosphate-dependent protein